MMSEQLPLILPVAFVQQQRMGECLAACAAMVLNYIGRPTPYRRLVKILETIPSTGTASFKVRNLTQLKINVTYQRGSLYQLYGHIRQGQPCIVFVKTSELPYREDVTDHAVVVIGFDNDYLYINDPEFAESPLAVPIGDFDLAWLERDEMYAVLTI